MTYKIIVASQKKHFNETVLYKSLCNKCIDVDDVLFFGDNKRSLASVYNEGIKKCRSMGINIAVFVHDDVVINCDDFPYRIRKCARMYTVTGLAGNSRITIKPPVLWHLMSDREHLRGCVAHGNEQQYTYTSFGMLPSSVVLVDGVFLIVNLNELPPQVMFDVKNPANFHFYDLIFSMDCCLNKIRVGIGDVPIIHGSSGLRQMTSEWVAGQEYFLTKYKQFVGKTLTV